MRKKELIERIEKLEEKLEKQQEVLEFLIEHGKDGVDTEIKCPFYWSYRVIKYLYKGELKEVELGSNLDVNIIKTTEKEIIFTRLDNIYYKIDKEKATYIQIPEPLFVSKDKEKETKAKKKGAKNET